MNSRTQLNSICRQRGIAMIELVIVAPVLLLILLGVSEMGRALFQYNTLSKAVRDSARYYSTQVFNSNDITGAKNLVKYGQTGTGTPLLPGSYTIPDPVTVIGATGTYVTVTGSYTFTFLPGNPLAGILGWFGSALPNPFVLTATSTMRAI
ncbi:TadE/TadG family type IV pilus assembly protein [Candidatus Methylobacter oryzae]|uniref:Pilus assembly protein n=1 Tax=Candidatus Methylobacter oryzae TaxID=2497749 RepID=A0ABY3C4N8_9GAMM|nr:TadE family protein [Candidatus Methylobacter oryzae]TRW89691.1 pilus assembly protein [Candidatus Methylobacter oryzae]